jgi:glycerol kinase
MRVAADQLVLALDQGTTSSRALLFDRAGRVRAGAQREFQQHFPQPGWVEHDAEEIWRSQLDAISEAMKNARVDASAIAAIGIANQRETTLLWDRATGAPLHRAIVWQDRRTTALCEQLRASGHEAMISERTGLLLDPYFSATKLHWLLDHIPGARERARRGELAFGTIDSWLVWKLSGGRLHVTDASNASRTLLYDLHRGAWDEQLLALFDIPRAVLPTVGNSSAPFGETDGHWLGAPVLIGGIAGDQQAATFGQACLTPGMAKCTYGTGCFMLMNTGHKPVASRHRLLTTVAWQLNERLSYALEGGVFMGGAIVQWLRDGLGIIQSSAEVEALAASVPDSGGVTLIPAFVGLGAPWWQPDARAALVGMTRGTGRGHIARAALDAIALQCAELFAAMERDSSIGLTELRVDGGAARNDLLMQIQADMLGVPVVRPEVTETTALGAACLAGLAAGFWQSPEECAAGWRSERSFEPALSDTQRRARLERWQHEVGRIVR